MFARGALAVLDREDTDEALVERVRQGDDTAFEELYRRHSRIAVAVARKILRSPQDSEDAAAEAFTNVLSALRRQVGPREMFRPYLLTCVKNTCALRIRQRSKQACSRDRSFADVDPLQDERVVEGAVASAAFRAIPARWQSALWMAEVEHLEPAVIADRLDIKVPAAAALVYRARQGFTEAYLAQHLRCSGQPSCVALGPKLAQYVRGTAGTMASRQVEAHIEQCSACTSALAELSDVNSSLRSITGPLSLVTAAGATATAASGGGAAVATGLGWLAKVAAVAALSAAPLLAGDESFTPVSESSKSTSRLGAHVVDPTGSAPRVHTRAPGRETVPAATDGRSPTRPGATDYTEPASGGPANGLPVMPSAVDPIVADVEPSKADLPPPLEQTVGTTFTAPVAPSPTIDATAAVNGAAATLELLDVVLSAPIIPSLPSLSSQSTVAIPLVPVTVSVSATGEVTAPSGAAASISPSGSPLPSATVAVTLPSVIPAPVSLPPPPTLTTTVLGK